MQHSFSRRTFLSGTAVGVSAAVSGSLLSHSIFSESLEANEKPIEGFDRTETEIDESQVWKPFSDRKIRIGIVGYGVCRFGAAFGYQDHPNVEVVAVSDLFSDRCDQLAQACRCKKQYSSLEKLVEDDSIEAVFIATDAPSHTDHCLKVLAKGKHVICAVPAVYGSLEEAEQLLEAVKKSGKIYALNETSAYHDAVFASRKIYQAGGFGKMVYTEGEYFHYFKEPIGSYKDWRVGLPPQWYPTHSNAYYTCVTGGSFTEVSCFGHRGRLEQFQAANNRYQNPFGSETALFRTSEGGTARMIVSWDAAGPGNEAGRNRGELGAYLDQYHGTEPVGAEIVTKLNTKKPGLPLGMQAGGHGGSHAYLTIDFIDAILRNRKPCVDIIKALNTTVSGIVAHQSALKEGELLKIPQYQW